MENVFIRLAQWSSAPRPARDVIIAIALKGVLLLSIYLLFFGPTHRSPSDAAATATALIGADAQKELR